MSQPFGSSGGSTPPSADRPGGTSAPVPPPDPTATQSDLPPVKATKRPHPLTPLIRGWVVLLAILFGLSRELIPDENGRSGVTELLRFGVSWVLLGLIAIVLLAALAGFMSWYYTRYVIDDEEFRVETGWLAKRSRRIAFERIQSVDIIQPLAARIFSLVEMRIEAGAGDSRTTLRYLTRKQAGQMRDYLLARAHGDQVTVAGTSGLPEASAFSDLSSSDRVLVKIAPQLLIYGLLLSSEFIVLAGIVVIAFVVATIAGLPAAGFVSFIPLLFGSLSMITRRVTAQFNYTLAESARGLRITRGLTNLSSQSLPLDRIQGVRITQPLLWRRPGWYRVDVDVLGYGSTGEGQSQNSTDVSSILLPIAGEEQVRTALHRVLPDAGVFDLALTPSPRRARAIRWFDGHTLGYGWNTSVIVSRHGWLDRVLDVVPHAKTQSVRITRGPLQRRLRLASVHVDTPKGPVNLTAYHLDPADARELALTQLDRARRARAEVSRLRESGRSDVTDATVLARFGIGDAEPLGSGGESVVYPLGDDQVLRIYRGEHESAQQMIDQLRPAYQAFDRSRLGFQTPLIIEAGEVAGRTYSIDRRMTGTSLSNRLPGLPEDARHTVLLHYLEIATRIRGLPLPGRGYSRLFGADRRSFDTLGELLEDQLRGAVRRVRANLQQDLPADAVQRVIDEVSQRSCEPMLVHGDYFPGNVYAAEVNGELMVTGVGDFSPHTLSADPVMDIAGAVELMGLEEYPQAAEDSAWLREQAIARYAGDEPDLAHWLDVYRRYYAVYFADDPRVYPYSLQQLAR